MWMIYRGLAEGIVTQIVNTRDDDRERADMHVKKSMWWFMSY